LMVPGSERASRETTMMVTTMSRAKVSLAQLLVPLLVPVRAMAAAQLKVQAVLLCLARLCLSLVSTQPGRWVPVPCPVARLQRVCTARSNR
jgi:hypothetical protein